MNSRRATTAYQHAYTMVCRHLQFCSSISIPTRGILIVQRETYKCILDAEIKSVLQFCHAASGRGHYGSTRTAKKFLDCEFYWPTMFRDAYQFFSTREKCQKTGTTIIRRHEMPKQPILFCEVFDIEAIATKTNDTKVVVDFLKSNIFYRFGMPEALISDQGKSRKHCKGWPIPAGRTEANSLGTLYGHIELHTGLRWGCLPTGLSSIKAVMSQTSSVLAVKYCNLAYDQAGKQRKFQLQELDKLRLEVYEKSHIYKQKVKQFHDKKRSQGRSSKTLIAGKLRSRWDGPFVITNVFPYGVVELKDEHTNTPSSSLQAKAKKTMIKLNLRGHRSFGIVLGVGLVQVWGRRDTQGKSKSSVSEKGSKRKRKKNNARLKQRKGKQPKSYLVALDAEGVSFRYGLKNLILGPNSRLISTHQESLGAGESSWLDRLLHGPIDFAVHPIPSQSDFVVFESALSRDCVRFISTETESDQSLPSAGQFQEVSRPRRIHPSQAQSLPTESSFDEPECWEYLGPRREAPCRTSRPDQVDI
ncbi:putative mitochondrial protein, partial [Mucuna pruriens]